MTPAELRDRADELAAGVVGPDAAFAAAALLAALADWETGKLERALICPATAIPAPGGALLEAALGIARRPDIDAVDTGLIEARRDEPAYPIEELPEFH